MADEQAQQVPDTPPQEVMSVEQAWQVVANALAQARFPDLPLAQIQTVLQAWGIVAAELQSAQAKNGSRAQRRAAKR